jgi:hypothetical protein
VSRSGRERGAHLLRELEALFERANQPADAYTTSIPATFLRVTVSV